MAREIVIGAQVSAAGGVSNAVQRALDIGAQAVQIFVDQNRQYPRKALPLDELDSLRALLKRHRIPGYVHVPYLANVATADEILRSRSIEMIARALQAGSRAGMKGVVVHPGSHRGRGFDAVKEQVVLALGEAWRLGGGALPLLIENTAGGGGLIGSSTGELRVLLDDLDRAGVRVGLCVDFAHVHAAGWDLGRKRGSDAFVLEWREAGLLKRVALVHANDSNAAAGSRRDWHANPCAGTIGTRGFRKLAAVREIARVPWILEAPGLDHSGPRGSDVARLRLAVTS
ncbi:MAG TPA: deoxyribonuclease IV [Candidatus Limnocylindria bacterium]|nr:deoxyribonuclease IV [Candidatus Limnocylindria bacterium]